MPERRFRMSFRYLDSGISDLIGTMLDFNRKLFAFSARHDCCSTESQPQMPV